MALTLKFCGECGAPLEKGGSFCCECGTAITGFQENPQKEIPKKNATPKPPPCPSQSKNDPKLLSKEQPQKKILSWPQTIPAKIAWICGALLFFAVIPIGFSFLGLLTGVAILGLIAVGVSFSKKHREDKNKNTQG